MPANLNWEGGATVPYSTSLVWAALVTQGGLAPDQAAGARVLVLDCVTDTGVLATQLATMWVGDIMMMVRRLSHDTNQSITAEERKEKKRAIYTCDQIQYFYLLKMLRFQVCLYMSQNDLIWG